MDELNENINTFLPFVEDLRARLYRGIILFAVVFLVGFLNAGPILKSLLGLIQLDQVTIATSSPFQFVDVAMDVGFFLAIITFTPYVIYSVYSFIVPALTKDERRKLLKSIPVTIILFAVGFCYSFGILYYALQLLAAVNISLGIANFWNIAQFLSEIFITSALLGAVFEFPLVLTLLMRLGVITTQHLRDQRRLAYFLIFLMVSLLPPTDGISLVVMSMPLVLLYEATILVNNKNHHVWTRT